MTKKVKLVKGSQIQIIGCSDMPSVLHQQPQADFNNLCFRSSCTKAVKELDGQVDEVVAATKKVSTVI